VNSRQPGLKQHTSAPPKKVLFLPYPFVAMLVRGCYPVQSIIFRSPGSSHSEHSPLLKGQCVCVGEEHWGCGGVDVVGRARAAPWDFSPWSLPTAVHRSPFTPLTLQLPSS
jgi:hypothetical protein